MPTCTSSAPPGSTRPNCSNAPSSTRQLVHAELRVAVQFRVGRPGRAGLQVHDDAAAALVALQPVHPPGDLHLADPDPEGLLHRDQLAGVAAVPGQEPGHHAPRELPLLVVVPGAAEVQVVPDVVDALLDSRLAGALGGQNRRRVDDRAQVPQYVRGRGPGAASSSQRSPRLVNDSTWDGDSWMVPPVSGPGIGQRGQRVPLPRVRAADPGRGEPGQLGRGGGP